MTGYARTAARTRVIYAEPENCRGRSFHGLLTYLLHDAGNAATGERVLFTAPVNLVTTHMSSLADELSDPARRALLGRRRGQKPDRIAFHFVLSWHPDDAPETRHMIETARSALRALGLAEHLAVIVGHTDTKKPHVHAHQHVQTQHVVQLAVEQQAAIGADRRAVELDPNPAIKTQPSAPRLDFTRKVRHRRPPPMPSMH